MEEAAGPGAAPEGVLVPKGGLIAPQTVTGRPRLTFISLIGPIVEAYGGSDVGATAFRVAGKKAGAVGSPATPYRGDSRDGEGIFYCCTEFRCANVARYRVGT